MSARPATSRVAWARSTAARAARPSSGDGSVTGEALFGIPFVAALVAGMPLSLVRAPWLIRISNWSIGAQIGLVLTSWLLLATIPGGRWTASSEVGVSRLRERPGRVALPRRLLVDRGRRSRACLGRAGRVSARCATGSGARGSRHFSPLSRDLDSVLPCRVLRPELTCKASRRRSDSRTARRVLAVFASACPGHEALVTNSKHERRRSAMSTVAEARGTTSARDSPPSRRHRPGVLGAGRPLHLPRHGRGDRRRVLRRWRRSYRRAAARHHTSIVARTRPSISSRARSSSSSTTR